jgi:hypothetical protein
MLNKVHVQGWGQGIFTLGQGDIQINGNDQTQWYANQTFGGTSGASGMVAGGCASLQSHAVNKLCRRLTNSEIRTFLINSGIPQGSGVPGSVGPFISMPAAMNLIDGLLSLCLPFRRGDVTANGTVDISDPISLLNYLFAGAATPSCLDTGDANDNGINEITDAIFVLNFLFSGSGVPPPPPGPFTCGLDPTTDNVTCSAYPSC